MDRMDKVRHFWEDGKNGEWVLVGEYPSVMIRNKVTRSFVSIEDDELLEFVIQKMLEAGVPVVKSLQDPSSR